MNAASDEYAFEKPPTRIEALVRLAQMADDAVPARTVGGELGGGALADHTEAVGVVDVEERAMAAGDAGERGQVGGVARDAVHAVHAHEAVIGAVLDQQPLEVVGILEPEPLQRGPAGDGELTAVVDRLVRAAVHEHRAAGGEHRDHRHVDVGDRGQDEGVLAAEKVGQALLDVAEERRAAQEARPARVRAPPLDLCRDRVHDLAVEVEPEVVARREVGQPLVADADPPPVDLVDHGVGHRIRALELVQISAGRQPSVNPLDLTTGPPALWHAATIGVHRRGIGGGHEFLRWEGAGVRRRGGRRVLPASPASAPRGPGSSPFRGPRR